MESDPTCLICTNWNQSELRKPEGWIPPPPPPPLPLPPPPLRSPNCLTSDQLNVLIVQYLQGEGFKHTAFAFENEAEIENIPVDKSKIGKEALPSFVHKGLRYTQLEANMHVANGDAFIECYRLEPLDIITNSVDGLSKIIKIRKESSKRKGNCIDYGVSNHEQESNKHDRNIDVHGDLQIHWHGYGKFLMTFPLFIIQIWMCII